MLQLDALEIFRVARDLISPWRTANGVEEFVESIVLKSTSSEGRTLWIEACPLATPLYLPETAETTYGTIVRHLAPMVLGKGYDSPQSAFDRMRCVKGNSFARAALDMSYWAHWCHETEQPLHVALGGSDDPVLAGRTINPRHVKATERAVNDGCRRLKVKLTSERDLDPLQRLMERFPYVAIHVDCNGAFSMADHEFFGRLDELGVTLIEQPLHYRDLPAHAELQNAMNTPIALDESVREYVDAEVAIRLGACQAMCLKPGRVGGITELMRILELCRKNGVGCYVGGMLESGLGTTMNVELASLDGMTYVSDLPLSGQYFEDDLIKASVAYSMPGYLTLGKKSWLDCEVDEDAVRKCVVESRTLSV